MPHKGESASFFLLHFNCNIQAGRPFPPSFLPPSGRSPPPLLRRESWAGEVSTQEPKLSTSSESPRRRATAGERERRRARGRRPAQPQRQRQHGLGSLEEPRLRAQQQPRLPTPASPHAPGRRQRTKRLCGAPGPGSASETGRRRLLCPAEGPASAHRASVCRERRRASSPRCRPPALRLCAALHSGTEESAGTRAPRGTAPAASRRSLSARQPHSGGREKERVSVSREGSHQAKAVERALRGSSEPSGRIVSFHQAPGLLPPT